MNTDTELPDDLDGGVVVPVDQADDLDGGEARNEDRPRRQPDAEKRINKLTARWKTAEENTNRERSEKEHARADAADLRRRLELATEAGHGVMTQNIDANERNAREKLRRAISEGDTEAHAEAVEALAEAKAYRQSLATAKQASEPRQQFQQPAQQPQVSPATAAWIKVNPWFNDSEKQSEAIGIHHALVAEGYVPESPAYFKVLTERTRELADDEDEPTASPPVKRVMAGAGVTRTTTPNQNDGTTYRLSRGEVEAAEALDMTPKEYAIEQRALRKAGKIK